MSAAGPFSTKSAELARWRISAAPRKRTWKLSGRQANRVSRRVPLVREFSSNSRCIGYECESISTGLRRWLFLTLSVSKMRLGVAARANVVG